MKFQTHSLKWSCFTFTIGFNLKKIGTRNKSTISMKKTCNFDIERKCPERNIAPGSRTTSNRKFNQSLMRLWPAGRRDVLRFYSRFYEDALWVLRRQHCPSAWHTFISLSEDWFTSRTNPSSSDGDQHEGSRLPSSPLKLQSSFRRASVCEE